MKVHLGIVGRKPVGLHQITLQTSRFTSAGTATPSSNDPPEQLDVLEPQCGITSIRNQAQKFDPSPLVLG